jgi:hypothetical protein
MSKVNLETSTLEELENECAEVQGTQFGHNMIGMICRAVEKRFGEVEADKLFETYQN